MKHLLYEQQNNIAELKAETLAELKVAQEGHNDAENTMWKEKREYKVQMKDQELAQQEVIRNLKKVCIDSSFHIDNETIFFVYRHMNRIHRKYAMIFFVKLMKLKKNTRKNSVIYVKKWNYVVKLKSTKSKKEKTNKSMNFYVIMKKHLVILKTIIMTLH